MRIERLDMSEARPVPTPADLIAGMDWAGAFVEGLMRDWPDHPYTYTPARYLDWINQFPPDPADSAESDRRRGRAVANMTWKLAPDEALILEFDSHDGFWTVTNMGSFFSSMDFLYRPVSYTPSRTKVSADGKVRLILAHDDPGYHNWLDTQGFELGNLTYRNLMSDAQTSFRTQVVKRADLSAALPLDTAKVAPEERVRQLHERFNGVRQRYEL